MNTYRVTGIIQVGTARGWSEHAISETVQASTPNDARQQVLTEWQAMYPLAIVRWYTPELVRAVWIV